MSRRYLVTAALPYSNNRLHLGHIAGAYLPADTYARYLRLVGDDVLFICGSDDHGVAIQISAQKEGRPPAEVVKHYHDLQEEDFRKLRIEFDIYSGTSSSPRHVAFSQEFFRRIYESGNIVDRETEQFYCESCDRFLPDRFVEGTCPICGAEGARGDQCDNCGGTYEQIELKDPHCAICGNPPVVRKTRHWFLKLDAYREELIEWLESREGWRETVRNYALGVVREGLPERSITRDLDWGVPVPLEEARGKVLYVWFDAPIGYLSFTQELFARRGDPDGWRAYWCDPETRVVHFIGKDNTIFHAVIWPAMLMGQRELNLPWNVPANEYLNFRGEKLSKSRGNAVWAGDALDRYEPDRLRYYLTANAPEGRDTNFSFEEFTKRNNEVLSDVLGNLCHRVFTFTERYFAGRIPDVSADEAASGVAATGIAAARDRWRDTLEACHFKDALGAVEELAREGNRLFDAAQPWKTRKEDLPRCARDIATCLELVHALGVLLAPFLPDTSAKVLSAFGVESLVPDDVARLGEPRLAAGGAVTGPGILFPRLED